MFVQTNDLEMEYIKLEVFGVGGGAPIMAKEHPALQELFKARASEPLSPLLCIVLIQDSQLYHFHMQKFDGVLCAGVRLGNVIHFST